MRSRPEQSVGVRSAWHRFLDGVRPWVLAVLTVALAAACSNTPERKANLREAARINVSLGAGYLNQGDVDLANEKLVKALQQAPDLPEAHWTYALLQMRLQNYEAAEQHFKKALELDPNDSRGHNNYGIFLCERGRHADAIQQFLKAAADPLYDAIPAAYVNAGVCAEKIPDPAAAERYLLQALEHDPNFPQALLKLAGLMLDQGRIQEAATYLQRYEAVSRPTAESLLLGYRLARARGDHAAARRYGGVLVKQFPDSPQAQEVLRR